MHRAAASIATLFLNVCFTEAACSTVLYGPGSEQQCVLTLFLCLTQRTT